jgi:hypothetical protein
MIPGKGFAAQGSGTDAMRQVADRQGKIRSFVLTLCVIELIRQGDVQLQGGFISFILGRNFNVE